MDISQQNNEIDNSRNTYVVVYCISCREILGKQYLASSPELDYIRGCFTLQVEKLNSYEVGSAETSGAADLADMLNVPSPGYLMARVNQMQFLIMSLNERIKKLESGETTQDIANSVNTRSTHAETESVTSSDNFSTNQQTYYAGSEVIDRNYGRNRNHERQEMLVARPLSEVDFREQGQSEKHTIPRSINSENGQGTVMNHATRPTFARHVGQRMLTTDNVNALNEQGDHDSEHRRENYNQDRQRQNLRKGRREITDMNLGEETLDQRGLIKVADVQNDERGIVMNSRPRSNRGFSPEMSNDGFISPSKQSLSRSRTNAMEVWPSPRTDRKGIDTKKRKLQEIQDSQ